MQGPLAIGVKSKRLPTTHLPPLSLRQREGGLSTAAHLPQPGPVSQECEKQKNSGQHKVQPVGHWLHARCSSCPRGHQGPPVRLEPWVTSAAGFPAPLLGAVTHA